MSYNEVDEDYKDSDYTFTWAIKPFVTALVIIAGITGYCFYKQHQIVRAIVGEASNQGFTGMVAVAEVIRHNGSLKGLYGLNAAHIAKEPKWVWKEAKAAWEASKSTNLTRGANHFQALREFKYNVNRTITLIYNDHVFYKE